MRKIIFAACLLVLAAAPVQAGPKQVFRKEVFRKVLNVVTNHVTLDFVAGGSSAFRTYSTYECRELGVEPCTAHYGSARTTEIAATIGTGVAIWLSEYGRKNGFKEWFVPEVAITAFNFAYGVRELKAKHLVEREREK